MQDQVNATPAPDKRVPWNKEQGNRSKAPAAPQTRLVDPDETPDRRPRSGPRHVQLGDRQQAAWL
jgi:hypothetical protein